MTMRILILGATGMLGHQLLRQLSSHHTVWGTSRRPASGIPNVLSDYTIIPELDALDMAHIQATMQHVRPDVIINCVGLIKQREQERLLAIDLNARLPHLLANMCEQARCRLSPHQHRLCVRRQKRRDVFGR